MTRRVLVIGNGGREHALAWKLAQSPKIGELYVAPGNGGTQEIAENVPIGATDIKNLVRFAEEKSIDLTVVGPEDALKLGIVDIFQSRGLRIFGPSRKATCIETSKAFAKRLMQKDGIPTGTGKIFRSRNKALTYIAGLLQIDGRAVIKENGLRQGKGVYICDTFTEAKKILIEIMENNSEVIVEQFLNGQEISIHGFSDGTFCNGKNFAMFPPSQDHKPIFDGDKGPNTGGMGTIVPVPWVSEEMLQKIKQQIVLPILYQLDKYGNSYMGCPFIGCLYPGLMMTAEGPKVLEFNARFGDPETQSYMRLLKTDLLDILEACVDGKLADIKVEWNQGYAACVVLASDGYPYPREYEKGIPIFGVKDAEKIPGVVVFHAGTMHTDQLRTSGGGRVLGVSTVGKTLEAALNLAYEEAIPRITFKGMSHRKDIGQKSLAMI